MEGAMLQRALTRRLVIGVAVGLGAAFSAPLSAADCGGNVSCACGDNVVASRPLVSGKIRDPVLNVACSGNGLILNTPGVVLDLNGGKIRGSGKGVGVLIAADGVTVMDGRIDKFGTGIGTESGRTTNGSLIHAVKPYYNVGDGVFLQGDDNELIDSPARHNGRNGTAVIGNNNTIEGHNNEYNGRHGFFVQGNGNQLIDNDASENRRGGNGMVVIGDANTIDGNWITKLNTDGIVVTGNGNVLRENRVEKQKRHGISVNGDNNTLTDNSATDNRGLGISVVGDGEAAASIGNRVAVVDLQIRPPEPWCEIYGVTTPPTCIRE
jgi:parallel beta-helix repeat protein